MENNIAKFRFDFHALKLTQNAKTRIFFPLTVVMTLPVCQPSPCITPKRTYEIRQVRGGAVEV